MDDKILFDRKLVLMNDGKYCLMLQVGDNHKTDYLNGRSYIHKFWEAFTDKDNQMFFTMKELQQRLFVYIAENLREDGTTGLCYAKNKPFELPNDLRRFFTTGLTSYATFNEFTQANNHFVVGYTEDNGDKVQFVVDTEDELKERLQNFRNEHGNKVYIGFAERNLNPLHLHGKFGEISTELDKWYSIVTIADEGSEDETKLYYRRSSNKRLLFTDNIEDAKPFATYEEAEKCMQGFPQLAEDVSMVIEEHNTPVTIKKREFIKNKTEME